MELKEYQVATAGRAFASDSVTLAAGDRIKIIVQPAGEAPAVEMLNERVPAHREWYVQLSMDVADNPVVE